VLDRALEIEVALREDAILLLGEYFINEALGPQ
jgi:hypothetical protein